MHRKYSVAFVESCPFANQEDLEFGVRHGLVETFKPVKFSHLFPEEKLQLQPWTRQLEVWRTIALRWALENCSDHEHELFDEVDSIYADFDYPEDMRGLVSYMPGDTSATPTSLKRRIASFYELHAGLLLQ